jgi:hypothetical protein
MFEIFLQIDRLGGVRMLRNKTARLITEKFGAYIAKSHREQSSECLLLYRESHGMSNVTNSASVKPAWLRIWLSTKFAWLSRR